jgi:DNA ligase (NAD+)
MDEYILNIPGLGKKKLLSLKNEIRKTLESDVITLLTGIELNGISRKSLEKISEYMLANGGDGDIIITLKDFIAFCVTNEVRKVEGYADENTNRIKTELVKNIDLIKTLASMVTVKNITNSGMVRGGKFGTYTFCFTGELETMKRDEAGTIVKKLGGKVTGVTKTLTYLVTNDSNSGSSKCKKALEYGTKIINEKEFLELVNE